ncbi:hypothetical protein TUBRATIS_23340 [Tubulinosema ratisbonensis]|uniref:Uncharacterized protein n=1 Tax=Tubulinosema ratisbonensis TaxID=291195 RepID=A0A437AJ83_9MICR|nr:hypothetical protein TUBRATIS_23340 [Tubulinosema ratisbonensis]
MKYSWKIFKYSKICLDQTDCILDCGLDLNTLSQTILHSEVEGNRIKQENWHHLYSQTNKTLEVSITDKLEIILFVYTLNEVKSYILESISFKNKMKWMAKGRSFACKIENKKFQISFYDQEEVNSFHSIFSSKVNFKIEEDFNKKIKEEFVQKMKKLNGKTKFIKENRKFIKSFEELKKEFINLVYFNK